jgi:parallel beta-helix repeat protein
MGNNIGSNNGVGIYLPYSSNNLVKGNNIYENSQGIGLSSSNNNIITNNSIISNIDGIAIGDSNYNLINYNNILSSTNYNIHVFSEEEIDATNNYWGTHNINEIESKLYGNISFLPFLFCPFEDNCKPEEETFPVQI